MIQRNIITTTDGSHTIEVPSMQVTYHSVHGAIQESLHVFIHTGLHHWNNLHQQQPCCILEMGFGTGLNALLTYATVTSQQDIYYETIEAFPLDVAVALQLNYPALLQQPGLQTVFEQLHTCTWNEPVTINNHFTFRKNNIGLEDYSVNGLYHIVYYDAFAPRSQPELWTVDVFRKLFNLLHAEGILVTYCSKGDVQRALRAAGFTVVKLPGPPGKREMLRAIKD